MFHLDRARAGQLITVTQADRQYRFQVVGKATFDRRHRLPPGTSPPPASQP